MSEQLGGWLRAQRRARRWDVPEMARQLVRAAGGSRDQLPELEILIGYIRRWERCETGRSVSERYMLLYCSALGIAVEQFGSDDNAINGSDVPVTGAWHPAADDATSLAPSSGVLSVSGSGGPPMELGTAAGPLPPDGAGDPLKTTTDVLGAWDELMKRRAFLRGAGGAGLIALAPYRPPELPPQDWAEAVEACSELTASCRRVEAVLGPVTVYGTIAEHQRRLASWLRDARSPAAWRQLAVVTADAGILLAWLSFDLDRFEEAAAGYRECSGLAQELEDTDLRAFLAGRMSRTLSECGRHADALAFADAADHIVGTAASRVVRSWLRVTRGYVHACLGPDHERSARADLDSAASMLAQASGDPPPPPYLAFYGQPYLEKWSGHALLALAEHKVARAAAEGRAAIDHALAGWAQADVRESGEVLAAAAGARLAGGEISEAARLTGRALQIASSTGSPRIMRYVTGLRRRMDPWRDSGEVRALDQQLLAGV